MIVNPKTIRRWTIFDWANSAYSLIIASAIFPAYYTEVVPDQIPLWKGTSIDKSVMAAYAISFSFLVIVLLSPILSGIADYSSSKKKFMRLFTHIGSIACVLMVFFTAENYWLGIVLSIIASIGFSGSLVFYNAFLPEIAPPEMQDSVSARGYMMGYIGAVILMFCCLIFIELNNQLNWGLGAWPVRLSFVAVGIWWYGFGEYAMAYLHDKPKNLPKVSKPVKFYFSHGYHTLKKAFRHIQDIPLLYRFLLAFFFYNMGVQTVMYMATYFASEEIGMSKTSLILTILLIQLLGILGAWLFSRIATRIGDISTLMIIISIWVGICIGAYFTYTEYQFFIVASFVGLVMGGVQSMSRSTYSKNIPTQYEENSSFFSFYDVTDKMATVIGTATFGMVATYAGGFRGSALALMVYFLIGFALLASLRVFQMRKT